MSAPDRPPFESLPLDASGPPGNAWGLYGKNDCLGALNMLTPAVVAKTAAEEIRTGERVSLDWELNKPTQPSFNRPAFKWHRIAKRDEQGNLRIVNDDHLDFNTQGSSQWDGFRHYGYRQAKKFYSGVGPDELDDPNVIGIDAWVRNGGIVGRGVLIDYAAYYEKKHGKPVDPFVSAAIPVDELKAILDEQRTTLRKGDILFLRVGFTKAYESLAPTAQRAIGERPTPEFLGVASTKSTLQWIWESSFAAVASDAPSFEQAPLIGPHTEPGNSWKGESWEAAMQGGGLLHQWVLAGWGCPIGEMFDLEDLAALCAKHKRYTFFVTSVPLKVPGGVASPPNAIAIF